MKQKDLCALYIAEYGGWVRAVEMKGKPYKNQFLGSESDRRMQEVIEEMKEKGYYEYNGRRYVFEEGRDGKFKTYRLLRESPAPKQKEFILGVGWL